MPGPTKHFRSRIAIRFRPAALKSPIVDKLRNLGKYHRDVLLDADVGVPQQAFTAVTDLRAS